MEFYIYATDADHALELAGNGADSEFESESQARLGYDREVHERRHIFRVVVEQAWTNPEKAAESYSIMK